MNHDIVVIGGSAGAIERVLDLVAELPAGLAATVFVVIHMPASHVSTLPEILTRRGRMPASHPLHEERILQGRVYVAPPDNHLEIRPGFIEVVRGPKDNGHRPAVDVLFRTAAAAYGARVIGVVLSGYQDCGTAGMMSIKARGGLCVVQDPESAVAPDMPRHAIERVAVDYVVHPLELPRLLARLVDTPAGPTPEPPAFVQQLEGKMLGVPAEVVCPICEGVMTQAHPSAFQHFRCHVGHAFTLESLVREQSDELERVLWAAVRALEESAALARRVGQHETGELKQRFAEKAQTHAGEAAYIRELLLHSKGLARHDAEAIDPMAE